MCTCIPKETGRAKKIIDSFDEKIREAIEGDYSRCVIMGLDAFHREDYDRKRFPSPEALIRHVRKEGFSPDLLNGACRTVAEWIREERPQWQLSIEIEKEADDDRYITSVYLAVSGWL